MKGVIAVQIISNEKRYRHELKYEIPYSDYIAMRSRLKAVMRPDPHAGPDGKYRIRSVYFDNSDDKALREKTDGIGQREKFRIRFYNDDLSYITLEKKIKDGYLCLKYDAEITDTEFRKILDGDISFMRGSENDLVKEFYAKMRFQRLKPRVLVSYEREPYIYKAGNVRITFDSKIKTSVYRRDLLADGVSDIIATDTPAYMLLEIKYDSFLPEIIQDIIQTPGLRQEAFSKYGASRRFG
ncbi:MAG: polyphosphate polymerase domain-containing protein [Clostridiales bacterium]|nr:polyphosphate polymerase domain-containing protein [Clostridiales bacterium]